MVETDSKALETSRDKLINHRREMLDSQRSILLLKVPEVIRATGLGRSTVYAAIASGDLPAVKYGRAIRVPLSSLEKWIETRLRTNQESD